MNGGTNDRKNGAINLKANRANCYSYTASLTSPTSPLSDMLIKRRKERDGKAGVLSATSLSLCRHGDSSPGSGKYSAPLTLLIPIPEGKQTNKDEFCVFV